MTKLKDIRRVLKVIDAVESNAEFDEDDYYVDSGSDIVPLYAVNMLLKVRGLPYNKEAAEAVTKIREISPFMGENLNSYRWGGGDDYVQNAKNLCEDIQAWIDSIVGYHSRESYSIYYDSLANFKLAVDVLKPAMYRVGKQKYITHFGAMLAQVENDLQEPLWMMVTKRKYVKLIRLKLVLGEKIPNNWIQCWINPHFDTKYAKDSKYKSVRKKFNDIVKPELEKNHIKLVYRHDIMKVLFKQEELPKFKRPREYKDWLKKIGNDFLTNESSSWRYSRLRDDKLVSVIQ